AARRVAGEEIAVDIGLGQACVLDRALGDFRVKLCRGFVGCMPGRMLVNPGNVGPALDGQTAVSGVVLFTLPAGFLGLSARPWQARNIPRGERATTPLRVSRARRSAQL